MRIEHIAMDVQDPPAVADWYVRNLGMRIVRKSPAPAYGHFLAPAEGAQCSMIEIYNNSQVQPLDFATLHPAILHLAFVSTDVAADRARLIAAGAVPTGDIMYDGEDVIATLRDPWGLAIQLAQRGQPMT